jgi:3'-phosphoadenosine 5'-phosphosulfate sulfotransferase (PAPS reductase)/FAD synthetase
MNKPKLHVVSLSGGKDSTAMLLRMLEEGMPVDEILFCDTGLEFDGMYHHIDKLEKYIGIPITRLKAPYEFEYLFFEHMPKRKNPELIGRKGFSWAGPRNRWCTAMLKVRIIDKYIRDLSKEYEVIQYIGIAADEPKRVRGLNYPLIEWGMTEADCLAYCKERGFDWDGLYDIFSRVSCWCCPLQSFDELRKLRQHFPELWERLRYMDKHTWRTFLKNYSVEQLDIRFDFEEERIKQGLPIKGRDFYSELKKRIKEEE